MSWPKVTALMFCLQLMVSNANAQAEAFAAAGDVSALAAAGNGAALAATGDTGYVQPIIVAFTSLNPYNAAQACASALNANEAAAIAAAFSQAKSSKVEPVIVCDTYNYALKISQAVAQACAQAIVGSYGSSTCSKQSSPSSGAAAAATAGK